MHAYALLVHALLVYQHWNGYPLARTTCRFVNHVARRYLIRYETFYGLDLTHGTAYVNYETVSQF